MSIPPGERANRPGASSTPTSTAPQEEGQGGVAVLGRVGATTRTINEGVGVVGALAGGILAEAFGVRPVLVGAGIGTGLSLLWMLSYPEDGRRTI